MEKQNECRRCYDAYTSLENIRKDNIELMIFKARETIKAAQLQIETARKYDNREIEFYYKGVVITLQTVLEDLERL